MPAPDVDWLLGQLEEQDAARLRPLLEELRALGLPTQPDLLQAVRRPEPAAVPQDAPQHPQELLRWLHGVEPHYLANVLRNEPPGLVARLLDSADWPWRAAVLEAQGPHRRRQIEECCVGACPPALSQALLAALWPVLRAAAATSLPAAVPAVAVGPTPLLRRLVGALRPVRERQP
jgi:predicted TIM-barrel fold metal-dependent hydrolase